MTPDNYVPADEEAPADAPSPAPTQAELDAIQTVLDAVRAALDAALANAAAGTPFTFDPAPLSLTEGEALTLGDVTALQDSNGQITTQSISAYFSFVDPYGNTGDVVSALHGIVIAKPDASLLSLGNAADIPAGSEVETLLTNAGLDPAGFVFVAAGDIASLTLTVTSDDPDTDFDEDNPPELKYYLFDGEVLSNQASWALSINAVNDAPILIASAVIINEGEVGDDGAYYLGELDITDPDSPLDTLQVDISDSAYEARYDAAAQSWGLYYTGDIAAYDYGQGTTISVTVTDNFDPAPASSDATDIAVIRGGIFLAPTAEPEDTVRAFSGEGVVPEGQDGSTADGQVFIGYVGDAAGSTVTGLANAADVLFAFDPATSELSYTGPALDHDTQGDQSWTLTFTLDDGSTQSYVINLQDLTDEPVGLGFAEGATSFTEGDAVTAGTLIGTVTATPDIPGAALTYSLAYDGNLTKADGSAVTEADFTFDEATGAISFAGDMTLLPRGINDDTATLTLTVTEENALASVTPATQVITLTVAAINDAPTFTDISFEGLADSLGYGDEGLITPVRLGSVTATDADLLDDGSAETGDTLTYSFASTPTFDGVAVGADDFQIDGATGEITYHGPAIARTDTGFVIPGDYVVSLSILVTDSAGATATATTTIDVTVPELLPRWILYDLDPANLPDDFPIDMVTVSALQAAGVSPTSLPINEGTGTEGTIFETLQDTTTLFDLLQAIVVDEQGQQVTAFGFVLSSADFVSNQASNVDVFLVNAETGERLADDFLLTDANKDTKIRIGHNGDPDGPDGHISIIAYDETQAPNGVPLTDDKGNVTADRSVTLDFVLDVTQVDDPVVLAVNDTTAEVQEGDYTNAPFDTGLLITPQDEDSPVSSLSVSDFTIYHLAEDGSINLVPDTVNGGSTLVEDIATEFQLTALSDGSGFRIEFIGDVDFDAGETSYSIAVVATGPTGVNGGQRTEPLTITIVDVNDQAPIFTSGATGNSFIDGGPQVSSTTEIYTAQATSPEPTVTSITYRLTDNDGGLFVINPNTGVVGVNVPFNPDFEDKENYRFTVEATSSDADGNEQTATQIVTIPIININDVAPVFTSATSVTDAFVENTEIPTTQAVYQTTVDADAAASVSFALTGTADDDLFDIDSDGNVTFKTATTPDFETKSSYNFTVTVTTTDGERELTATQDVTLLVENIVDIAPIFSSGTTAAPFTDNSSVLSIDTVYTASASTTDAASTDITYSLTGSDDDNQFNINDRFGWVSVKDKVDVDFESKPFYTFTVTATSTDGTNEVSTSQVVTIPVTNINDVAPTFTSGNEATAIVEGTAVPTSRTLYTALAETVDASVTSTSYALTTGQDGDLFDIDSNGHVTFKTATTPDFEGKERYRFTVEATTRDAEGNAQTATQLVTLPVTNVYDAPVTITTADSASPALENQAYGTNPNNSANVFYYATASFDATTSQGTDNAITWSIDDRDDGDLFAINSDGRVTFKANTTLDYEAKHQYVIHVRATDEEGATDSQRVRISVTDVNDEAPSNPVLSKSSFITNGTNANIVGTASVTDADAGDTSHKFSLSGDAMSSFEIGEDSGVLTFTGASQGQGTTYNLTITATDAGGNSSSSNVVILHGGLYFIRDGEANSPENRLYSGAGILRESDDGSGTALTLGKFYDTEGRTISGFSSTLLFSVAPSSRKLFYRGTPQDHETNPNRTWDITINFTDGTEESFTVGLQDVADEPVTTAFTEASPGSATFDEDSTVAADTIIGTVTGTPDVAGSGVTYGLASVSGTATKAGGEALTLDDFTIDDASGELRIAREIVFDLNSSGTVTVTVSAEEEGAPDTLTAATHEVTITVANVNQAPTDITLDSASFAPDETNAVDVGTFTVTDPDGDTVFTYDLTGTDAGFFEVDDATGVLSFKAGETPKGGGETYDVTVTVSDSGGLTLEKDFTVTQAFPDIYFIRKGEDNLPENRLFSGDAILPEGVDGSRTAIEIGTFEGLGAEP